MPQTIQDALNAAEFYTDDVEYALVHLPPKAITAAAGVVAEIGQPFAVLIVDKDEVTLLIPAEALEDFGKRLPGHITGEDTYALITLEVALEPTLTGFMAYISSVLAEAGVPIFPYAAYTRDHIVVPVHHKESALAVLRRLKSGA